MYDKIVKQAIDASIKGIGITDEDYLGADGLWYCGKCHTKKQTRITLFGEEYTPMCLCECAQKEIDRYNDEISRRELEEEIARRKIEAFDGQDMINWTFDRDDQTSEAVRIARKYVAHWDEMRKAGKGIIFFGDVGTGKSFAAACIANALIDKGYKVRMTSPIFVLKQTRGNNASEAWEKYDLLVLDDLTAERETTYAQEIVQQIIEARYLAKKPMIITSNLTAEELKNPVDIRRARMFSRILEICIPFEIKGGDRRKEILRADFEKYKKMLTEKKPPKN